MPSATFPTCISITYFTNRGNSHVLHNQNQANVTIMRKKTSLTNYLEFELKELHNMTINIKNQTSYILACAHVNKIGTLSNLDHEPSGRCLKCFHKAGNFCVSVMSSTWCSGRDICWFALLRWTRAFKAIFDISVLFLPCLIRMFEKRNLFCTFC